VADGRRTSGSGDNALNRRRGPPLGRIGNARGVDIDNASVAPRSEAGYAEGAPAQ
jgi:hypothetical protein